MKPYLFNYLAEQENGDLSKGVAPGLDEADVYRMLRAKRLEPLKIVKVDSASSRTFGRRDGANKLPTPATVRIFKKLAVLSRARASLLDCLQLCATQERDKVAREYMFRVAEQVRAGSSLSDAFAADAIQLPRLVYSLILTAERSGNFFEGFSQIATTLAAQERTRKDIMAHMIYPIILLLFVVATLFFISFFVLPQFERIFLNADSSPPGFTAFIMSAGQFVRAYAWTFPLLLLLMLLGGRLILLHARREVDRILIFSPFVGSFLRDLEAVRYCRSLGALLKSGTPLADSFTIAEQAITNSVVRDSAQQVARRVKNGGGFSAAAEKEALFSGEVISLLAIGERTGALAEMTLSAADMCHEKIEDSFRSLSAILGPALTALAGGLVALVTAAIMIGILGLNETVY